MRGVKYIGPVFDGSGYGEAARNYVLAIHRQGYPISVTPIEFEDQKPELGEDGVLLRSLCERCVEVNKVIIHSTRDLWHPFTHKEKDKYIIGQTVWESTRLHPVWVNACRFVDEVWVPSEWNVEVFRNSGVERPIIRVPHTLDLPEPEAISPLPVEGVGDQDFVFYSIFHWTERKNPHGLIATYLSAFSGVRNVVLALKTYLNGSADETRNVWNLIEAFKKEINLHHYPRIVVLGATLDQSEMLALHRRGDCFVLLQRAEGWGLPHFEAAAMGNPVITPGFGGQTDFLSSETSYLVDYTLRPVTGMSWSPFYQATQYWCEPDLGQAGRFMRQVFADGDEARERGQKARIFIRENFTADRIGSQIVEPLMEIDQSEPVNHG